MLSFSSFMALKCVFATLFRSTSSQKLTCVCEQLTSIKFLAERNVHEGIAGWGGGVRVV